MRSHCVEAGIGIPSAPSSRSSRQKRNARAALQHPDHRRCALVVLLFSHALGRLGREHLAARVAAQPLELVHGRMERRHACYANEHRGSKWIQLAAQTQLADLPHREPLVRDFDPRCACVARRAIAALTRALRLLRLRLRRGLLRLRHRGVLIVAARSLIARHPPLPAHGQRIYAVMPIDSRRLAGRTRPSCPGCLSPLHACDAESPARSASVLEEFLLLTPPVSQAINLYSAATSRVSPRDEKMADSQLRMYAKRCEYCRTSKCNFRKGEI